MAAKPTQPAAPQLTKSEAIKLLKADRKMLNVLRQLVDNGAFCHTGGGRNMHRSETSQLRKLKSAGLATNPASGFWVATDFGREVRGCWRKL